MSSSLGGKMKRLNHFDISKRNHVVRKCGVVSEITESPVHMKCRFVLFHCRVLVD